MWENIIRKYTGVRPSQAILLLCDLVTLQCVLGLSLILRSIFDNMNFNLYLATSLILFICPIFNYLFGTCEMPSPPPHKEVKKLFLGVSLAYLAVFLMLFMTKTSVEYSRLILFFSWLLSILAVPMVRGFVRRRLSKKEWWGSPVIFLHDVEDIIDLWEELEQCPERGLSPVAYMKLDFTKHNWGAQILKMQEIYVDPIFIWCIDREKGIEEDVNFEEIANLCKKILIVPKHKNKTNKFWLAPRVLGKSHAFLVRQNLMDTRRLSLKRIMDLFISLVALIPILPILLILASWVKLSSKGPAFYTQERIGKDGKNIKVFKFRTMVENADKVLKEYLSQNEELYKEWKATQKLKEDPRITPVGKFLRKTSLDELPQIFNVLLGNMSLVGPRPIVENEIERYGEVYFDYKEVKPGITGLWQISGRNNTSYEERIAYDRYYVTNWSVWMDLWILMRTVPVVIKGHGAY